MKTLTPGMQTHLESDVTTLASCWRVTRTDGKIFGFTDHDKDLLIEGLTFKASSGYFRSAITSSSEKSVDNVDVEGFLNDDDIAESELRAGLFDYATVEIFIVNWANIADGIIAMRYGLFGETIILSSGLFRVELRSMTQLFSQTIGEVYQPECRADLGDERCGVNMLPPQRRAGFRYSTGDRVLVPLSDSGLNADVRLFNNDFNVVEHTQGFVQSAITGLFTNEDGDTGEVGSRFEYRVKSRTGLLTRTLPDDEHGAALDEGMDPIYTPNDIKASVTAKWHPDYIDEEITITIRTSDNLSSNSDTVNLVPSGLNPEPEKTLTASIPYEQGKTYVIEIEVTNPSANAATVTDKLCALHSYRCFVDMVSDPGNTVTVDFKYNSFQPWDDYFENFGWTESHATYDVYHVAANPFFAPLVGEYMLQVATDSFQNGYYFAPQDPIDVAAIPEIDLVKLDAGDYELEIGINVAAIAFGNHLAIEAVYLDAGSTFISNELSGELHYFQLREWNKVSSNFTIPSGTRFIELRFKTYRTDNVGDNNLWFDSPFITLSEPVFLEGEYTRYGNVEFEAQGSGITATTTPVFDFTIGNTTTDGEITWEVRRPKFTVTAQITSVDNFYTFYSTDLTDYQDDYFNWGIIEFLDGGNVNRRLEVDDFESATGKITVKLPFPFTMEVGDTFRILAGCDKSRGVCYATFDNILNFRGEPDIPGTDRYFKVAGT